MHSALQQAGRGPVAALKLETFPWQWLNGRHALVALMAGVTWLALIGGMMGVYILDASGSTAAHHSGTAFQAYNTGVQAPTTYGALSVTAADMTRTGDGVEVYVSMRVENNTDSQIEAPRLENFRLLTTAGAEATQRAPGWSGPSILVAHSTATIDLTFREARADAGLLWLEYRDPAGPWPIRVELGSANPTQQPDKQD